MGNVTFSDRQALSIYWNTGKKNSWKIKIIGDTSSGTIQWKSPYKSSLTRNNVAYNNTITAIPPSKMYFKAIKSRINWFESRLISKFYSNTAKYKLKWMWKKNRRELRDFALLIVSRSLSLCVWIFLRFYCRLIILNRFSHDASFVIG